MVYRGEVHSRGAVVLLDRAPDPWPPCDVIDELAARQQRLVRLRRNPGLWPGAREYYRTRPVAFARHWCFTYDPRNAGSDTPATLPLVPFRRQRELIRFVYSCLEDRVSGLVEKSRDMGATWCACVCSAHLFLFWPGASVGWGSRKAGLVDRIGDPDSIFEKIRILLRNLPRELLPVGFSLSEHMSQFRIVNPETRATIVGEGGDDIGRGGRSLIYFKDESAHYEHPESIEAALSDNALVQIDISSVNGLGNVFHRRRESGVEWTPDAPTPPGRTRIFVMDWRDHPAKTAEWHEARRQKAEAEGLLHVFAQEVDRDYSAAVQGVVIPAEWVRSAIDVHERLSLRCDGGWCSALDVADEGGDTNAQATRRGVLLRALDEWGERDTGLTARRAVRNASTAAGAQPIQLQYDCVGVGAGVKAETNRLADDGLLPRGVRLVPWNAGEAPQDADRPVIPGDRDSPLWGDFAANLKAQGWWSLRRRFELTHSAVTLDARRGEGGVWRADGFSCVEDDLISLPSGLPLIWRLVKELSQPTMTQSTRLKLLIEKTPDGSRSPNLADALMMCYFPVRVATPMVVTSSILRRAATERRR